MPRKPPCFVPPLPDILRTLTETLRPQRSPEACFAETDSYVVMLIRKDLGGGQGEYRFWYLRPENVTDGVGVTAMRVGQCGENRRGQLPAGKSWHPDFLHDGVWVMGDAELHAYWNRHECNPANTGKTRDQPFWGEGWDQVCPYVAPSSDVGSH